MKYALSSSTEKDEPPKKKVKYESQGSSTDEVNSILDSIISGDKLSDLHINFAQQLLPTALKPFCMISGFDLK